MPRDVDICCVIPSNGKKQLGRLQAKEIWGCAEVFKIPERNLNACKR